MGKVSDWILQSTPEQREEFKTLYADPNFSNAQIASAIGLPGNTVTTVVSAIARKLECPPRRIRGAAALGRTPTRETPSQRVARLTKALEQAKKEEHERFLADETKIRNIVNSYGGYVPFMTKLKTMKW